MAKGITGLQKGIDEQGDVAIVLTSVDPAPKHVILVPVANFADFFAALNAKEPESGVVEVQLAGTPSLVGRKGSYAVIARATDRDALEKFLASTTNLATDTSLAAWLNCKPGECRRHVAGHETVASKTHGRSSHVAGADAKGWRRKWKEHGRCAQRLCGSVHGGRKRSRAIRNWSSRRLRTDGRHCKSSAIRSETVPGRSGLPRPSRLTDDLLGGLEAKPFVMAMGGAVPEGSMKEMMKMSVKMMQNQPDYKLTPEQAQKYIDLSTGA